MPHVLRDPFCDSDEPHGETAWLKHFFEVRSTHSAKVSQVVEDRAAQRNARRALSVFF